MFDLIAVQFISLTTLTLVFDDTIDPTNPANSNPANYIISGGVQVVGNFSFNGPQVSFTISQAVIGQVYDIQVQDLVSENDTPINTAEARESFYYGNGVITPMLIASLATIGSLYVISDSALVGPIQQSATVNTTLGTVIGESIVDSYNGILEEIPAGGFYNLEEVTLPFNSGSTSLLLLTDSPNTQFALYLNNIYRGVTTSNWEGWAGFNVRLPVGDCVVQIFSQDSTTSLSVTVTSPKYVSWVAGMADSLEQLTESADQVHDSMGISTVLADDIEANFGQFVATPQVSNYTLEVYRNLLIEVIQAFKFYSGTIEGLCDVIAAFSQVRPILKWFQEDAPRWILGWQHLMNRRMTQRFRYASSTFVSTNIVAVSCSDSNENGAASVLWDPTTSTLQYKSVRDSNYGPTTSVSGIGKYTMTSQNGVDTATMNVGNPTPSVAATIPVTITGPAFPTNVVPTNANLFIQDGAYLQRSGLRAQLVATAANPSVMLKADPTTFQHLGELFVASFWILQNTGETRNYTVAISEDGGDTWDFTSAPQPVTPGSYQRVDFSGSIGYFGVTDIRVKLIGVDTEVGESFYVEKACLHSPQTGGLYLSENTRARSRRRKFFGYKCLFFSNAILEAQAYNILGYQPSLGWGLDSWGSSPYGSPSYGYFQPVSSSPASGLINYIIPTQCEIDVFQDIVVPPQNSAEGIVNVVGVFTESAWKAGAAVNFTIVPQNPDRFTYAAPSTPSNFSETVVFDGGSVAELSQVSTQNAGKSRLLQDGVPVPNTEWQYIDTDHIELLTGPPNVNSIYTFSYPIVMSYLSTVIDLGANFSLFNWYADWYEYNRVFLAPTTEPQTDQISFSSVTLLGSTSQIVDTTAGNAILFVNNGQSIVTQVSTTLWAFTTPQQIKINPSAFNAGFTYSLQYTAQSLIKKPIAQVTIQVKYSEDDVNWSDWVTIPHDAPFGNRFRYFQFNVSVTGITDIRDYRLRSLTLKGDPLDRATVQGQVT